MLTFKSASSALRPKHALRSLNWSESLFTPKPSPPPSQIEARTFMVGEYFTLPYRQYSPINVVMNRMAAASFVGPNAQTILVR